MNTTRYLLAATALSAIGAAIFAWTGSSELSGWCAGMSNGLLVAVVVIRHRDRAVGRAVGDMVCRMAMREVMSDIKRCQASTN